MRERKKSEAEEMLVVHKAAKAVEPQKAGRERGPIVDAMRSPALDREEFEVMKKRFVATRDPEEQRRILAEVQRRFGNDKAAELVKEAQRKDDGLSAKLAVGGAGKSKK